MTRRPIITASIEAPLSWQVRDTIATHGLAWAVRFYRLRAANPLTALEFRIFAGI